jgi:hypothetical protein
MGHLKIKKIEIKNNKVYMLAAASNVLPLCYEYKEYPSMTEKLQKGGESELDFAILREYESGCFQHHSENEISFPQNKYSKAIFLLKQQYDYKKIDWRLINYSIKECNIKKVRESDEYKKIILSALKLKPTKGFFVIRYSNGGYYVNITRKVFNLCYNIEKAKVFKKKEEAIYLSSRSSYMDAEVIELNNN